MAPGKAGASVKAERIDALVIGGGPAGLMAAERLSMAGRSVTLAEAMPSVGRKLLMAGKSGLNLTRVEDAQTFLTRYAESAGRLRPMLASFGGPEVADWARGLGQDLFTGSTGRVFPTAMKASPLLRAWLNRLRVGGVQIRTRWRWTGWTDGARFDTPEGARTLAPGVTVLALGGASWRRLGSDGAWTTKLGANHVELVPFAPANVGLHVAWSEHMRRHCGTPIKGVAWRAGSAISRGEAVISGRGLEGGGIYPLSRALRQGASLWLDLLPHRSVADVVERLARPRGRATRAAHLRRTLRLDAVQLALLQEFGRPLPDGPALAALVKSLPVRHSGPRAMDEAISTAGGVCWNAVAERLMLHAVPGVFVAGEMLDWEAPTGGYLLSACLSTGRWAGRHAAAWR